MKKYRKKPVVIEAIQLTAANRTEVFHWIYGTEVEEVEDGEMKVIDVGVKEVPEDKNEEIKMKLKELGKLLSSSQNFINKGIAV